MTTNVSVVLPFLTRAQLCCLCAKLLHKLGAGGQNTFRNPESFLGHSLAV